MSINQSYAVFGLGRYGLAVAKELVAGGADVLAVDINEDKVNSAISEIPVCKCADVTDADVIERLGIANIDTVIIAMAENLEASVIAKMLCKQAAVTSVIGECAKDMRKRILRRGGANKVVFPESESGIRLAKNLLSSGFVDLIELSQGVSMVELDVKEDWVGKNLLELNLRKKYSMNVVAVRHADSIKTDINPEEPLQSNSKLIVIANVEKLNKLK